jgi:hypothetical protein
MYPALLWTKSLRELGSHTAFGGILRRAEQYSSPGYSGNASRKFCPAHKIPVNAPQEAVRSFCFIEQQYNL